ncbi:condensin complex subunit 1-like [Drosophila madeirensis]|uniref:Condensin complex subunit 1-like n=1 Tax=Drosophila madeirensis TaxID=30013 RepID=A0AAU9G060_DROMD
MKLQECNVHLSETFKTFFSVIESNKWGGVSIRVTMQAFDLMFLNIQYLVQRLTEVLAQIEPLTKQRRLAYLNVTQMMVYLQVNIVKQIDSMAQHPRALAKYPEWEKQRLRFLFQLLKILQLPLQRLWSPLVVGDDFIAVICSLCYDTIIRTPIDDGNQKMFTVVFSILGSCIIRFNHSNAFKKRILQILRDTTHAASSVARGILTMHENCGVSSIFCTLLNIIVKKMKLKAEDTLTTVSEPFSVFLAKFSSFAKDRARPFTRNATIGQSLNDPRRLFFDCFYHQKLMNFDGIAMCVFDYIERMYHFHKVVARSLLKELLELFDTNKYLRESTGPGEILPFMVTRFLFCIGYMTIQKLINLEIDFDTNKQCPSDEQTDQPKPPKLARLLMKGVAMQEPYEDGSNITDVQMYALCEDMLKSNPMGLVHRLKAIIHAISKKPSESRDPLLQRAVVTTLARLMCLSSSFCPLKIPFLMDLLQLTSKMKFKSGSALTMRFPNIIEMWSWHLYWQVRSTNAELRLTAAKIMSHLLINDFIPVKEQISGLAQCIMNSQKEIQETAKQFFQIFANKNLNLFYKLLPGIILQLGDSSLRETKMPYNRIKVISFLMGLIPKDGNIEKLLNKLIRRLGKSIDKRQCRDIALSLSQIKYNVPLLTNLMDKLHRYHVNLQQEDIHQQLSQIIKNCQKRATPEMNATIAEFKKRLMASLLT